MKLLFDFFPLLLFFAAYKFYGIYTATAVAIAASVAQVSYARWRHDRIETMHLISLGLIVVLGGATLVLHDDIFIKWKPTAVDWLFSAAFLGSQWFGATTLTERMLGKAITVPASIWRRVNLSWVVFFLFTGILNLYVAFFYAVDLAPKIRTDIWVDFKVYGILALTLVFMFAQTLYLSRHMAQSDEEEIG